MLPIRVAAPSAAVPGPPKPLVPFACRLIPWSCDWAAPEQPPVLPLGSVPQGHPAQGWDIPPVCTPKHVSAPGTKHPKPNGCGQSTPWQLSRGRCSPPQTVPREDGKGSRRVPQPLAGQGPNPLAPHCCGYRTPTRSPLHRWVPAAELSLAPMAGGSGLPPPLHPSSQLTPPFPAWPQGHRQPWPPPLSPTHLLGGERHADAVLLDEHGGTGRAGREGVRRRRQRWRGAQLILGGPGGLR